MYLFNDFQIVMPNDEDEEEDDKSVEDFNCNSKEQEKKEALDEETVSRSNSEFFHGRMAKSKSSIKTLCQVRLLDLYYGGYDS